MIGSCPELYLSGIDQAAHALGLHLTAVLTREEAATALDDQGAHLAQWQASGHAGEMGYMQRPVSLFTDLDNFLPGTQTVLVFAVCYGSEAAGELPAGYGRVARYARGRDYHSVLRMRLAELAARIGLAKREWRAFTDAVPLLERALGARAGLGFVGKNSMLIRPGMGSYFFLAELLLTRPVAADRAPAALKVKHGALPSTAGTGCGDCFRCSAACPTGAILGPAIVDARRCISYLTIEKRGEFAPWERRALGHWIFGCDICQEVCPFNHAEQEAEMSDFESTDGCGPFLALSEVLCLTEEGFRQRFAATPLARPRREGLIRNACAVVANTRYFPALDELMNLARHDASALIRNEASAALQEMAMEAEGLDRVRIRSLLKGGERQL